ncbi:MurR/RpiR family transcriptional regulator [Acidaminobacter hydrogenoformans]|uniref:Transcriptional regulator, RpiR family n=1 Tax=Acidaminobacter hydrogenoformans DSM 2784 TaxID=1120920 RepID=A0A1G5RRX6_9FIRM|nr:MurR/RpiR family transcriptional regulator [Acidaminobacter hydrogenoformans]SCZ76767.1 transcriptional regulator, RpiR family [Acidaminobacter hydrogenoformans DSM 2784]
MADHNDLLNRIEKNYMKLSKGQKRIADFILQNYDKVAFMTASTLGDSTGVSESTVVRFANALGYDGYPKLQKGLQESIKTKLTTVQRFELSKELEKESSYTKKVMNADMDNIRRTLDGIDEGVMEQIVEDIHNARRVYILGMRSSSVLANYLGFYLNFILKDVVVVNAGALDVFDHLINITKDDLLITISFPRYAKRTFEIVDFANAQGATIVGITDSPMAPLVSMVKHVLFARYNMNTFIDSLVAPMSLINALIQSVSIKEMDRVEENFEKLENIWNEYKIYNPK